MSTNDNDIENKLPKGWFLKTYYEIQDDNLIGLVKNSNEQGLSNEFKYIKMNNISSRGYLDLTNYTCVDATEDEKIKYSLSKGDFLFNTRNSIELVGKSCIYELDEKFVLFNNNILRTRFKKGIIPKFISYQFQSSFIKQQLENVKSGTTNVAAIYYKSLARVKLVIANEKEQQRIVNICT